MRARIERRKRTAKCPECGEFFSPQGLHGHLKYVHGLRGEEMRRRQTAAVVAGGVAERARITSELIRQLRELEAQRAGLFKPGPRDSRDDAWRDCVSALDSAVLEIRNEIRKLEGKRPVVPVKRQTFGEQFLGFSFVEEEPDVPPGTSGKS